jgi:hypothetical protein
MYKSNKQYPDAIENLRLAVKGGKNKDSVDVQGMLLDYGRVAEYYYTYGLVLARQGQCGEAIQISNALSQGVPNDETAVYNAQEMINICQGLSGTPSPGETPLITETTPAETTPTPSNGQ